MSLRTHRTYFARLAKALQISSPRRHRNPPCRLELQTLEERSVPSCNPGISGGVLQTNCSFGPDVINLDHAGSTTTVSVNLGNPLRFSDSSFSSILLQTGSTNGQTVFVNRTPAGRPVTVFGGGSINSFVYLDDGSPGGSMQGILSPVTITDPPSGGRFFIELHDYSDPGFRHVTLTASSITGLAPFPINYTEGVPKSLAVSTGVGGSIVDVLSTPGFFADQTTDLFGHSGSNDTVNIGNNGGLQDIQGNKLTITNLKPGIEQTGVNVDDHSRGGNRTATLDTFSNGSLGEYVRLTGLTSGPILAHCAPVRDFNLQTGTGAVTANVLATCGHGLNLNGHGPNAVVNVGNAGSLAGIQSLEMTIANHNGDTGVAIDDHNRAGTRTATFSTVVSDTQYTSVSGLAPATIYSQCAASRDVAVYTGTGAVTANVLATCGHGLNLHGNGPNATVNVGNAGSLAGIQSLEMTISNGNGDTGVVIDDHNRAGTRTATFNTVVSDTRYVSLSGLAPATIYSQCAASRDVDVYTGTGAVTANVLATCGHGLNLHGGSGTNTLVGPVAPTGFNITGNNAGTLTGGVSASFSNFQNLIGGSGGDAFIFADGAGVGGSISNNNGAASTLDYSAYSTPVTVDLSANSATGVGGSVAGIVTLRGGTSDDSLTGNAAGGTIFVASPGNDTITGLGTGNSLYNADANGTADSTWSVTAQNSGTLSFVDGTTTFSGMQNLTGGGTGAATFILANGAGVDGGIQGSGGANSLDYTAYTSAVYVNLQEGIATGVGAVMNIQTVTGGQGANILVGDGNENLTGGPGHNLLISGGGSGQLTGGGAGDIVIGGTTAYDTDDASLQAILSYWTTSGDDYATRVANLRAGNGVPQMEGGLTVFDHGAANTVTGNGSEAQGIFNLFYMTEAGTVTDPQLDEVVVDIDNPAGAPRLANHGDRGNTSRESLPAAAAADRYFLRHQDELSGSNAFAAPVPSGPTLATERIHSVVRAADWMPLALDLFAQ